VLLPKGVEVNRRKPVIQEILDSMPYLMREKAKAQVAKLMKQRPPLTTAEFIVMWNRCVKERKHLTK